MLGDRKIGRHAWVAAAGVLLTLCQDALAGSQRTFVGTSGTDNPNCSLAAPCRTFAAAIAATNAGGEVIVLQSGGYGTATIAKSVSMVAPPGIYAGVSVASGDGFTIDGTGIVVALRGLSINGVGGTNGISIHNAAKVDIEGCTIANFVGAGIQHLSGQLHVKDTLVRDNTGIGVWSIGTPQTDLQHVRLEANLDGVRAQDGAQVVVEDSVMVGNAHVGAFAFSGGGTAATSLTVIHSVMSFNQQGVQARSLASTAAAYANVTDSTMANNINGLLTTQDSGGNAAIYAVRNAITASSGADVSISANTFGFVDGNYMPGVYVAPGGTIMSRSNNTAGSVGVFGTLDHEPPF